MYQPFFYIIKHIPTGKLYAGSKTIKALPHKFMTKGNYQTSSKQIKNLIKEYGLESFEILRIDTYCDNLPPYDYETLFLKTIDAKHNFEWLNGSNNDYHIFREGNTHIRVGLKHKKESKDKISASKKGENNPMYGKKHTEQVRIQQSNLMKEWHKTNNKPKKDHSNIHFKTFGRYNDYKHKCPKCSLTTNYANLVRHMRSKHPFNEIPNFKF